MRKFRMRFRLLVSGVLLLAPMAVADPHSDAPSYLHQVQTCVDTLIAHGTDTYGEKSTPLLVSILDVNTLTCPENPAALDEAFRVVRRERRNPAGANLLTDQPMIAAMLRVTERTGNPKYADAARAYTRYCLQNLVDDNGLLWWGWHRHYDVFRDSFEGHSGNHHEIHAIQMIDWDVLWELDPDATRREIEAIWTWHVIDKQTGEINRHADGKRGCDFSMSAGSHLRAFAFLYTKTNEGVWLERAKLLANYYYDRRNPDTNLFPERPNAGTDRFDGSAFVTSITGCYCRALLDAYRMTGDPLFKDHASVYLSAYANYGYDATTGKYWGALSLDGTPIPGPRSTEEYAMYEPRGYLDLWEPYAAGYQYAIYTAEAYLQAYRVTNDTVFLTAAKRFADWIGRVPPGTVETENTWYSAYTNGPGKEGTYAGKYGRAISFLVGLYGTTGEEQYRESAVRLADEAVTKLYSNGVFRGHPAKPYYEAMDGVGYLLLALLDLGTLAESEP